MFPFKLRVARCCRHISSTLKTKLSAKENSLVLFWRTIKDTPRWSIGVFYTFAKLELFWLLVLVVCDSVITLGEIAYNVNIILREVFLAIVCTVHNTNILKTTSFFSEGRCQWTLYPSACHRKDKQNCILKVSFLFLHIERVI